MTFLSVLLISKGETCSDIAKRTFFQRIFTKDKKSQLIPSSEQQIDKHKFIETVDSALSKVHQVVSNYDEGSVETAHLFLPHMKADTIRFKNVSQFRRKIAQLAYTEFIAIFITQEQFKMLTGVDTPRYLAIHMLNYEFSEDALSLDEISGRTVFLGETSYETAEDNIQCNIKTRKTNTSSVLDQKVQGQHCCWLAKVKDGTYLRDLKVPQAHDAATGMMKSGDRSTWRLKDVKYLPIFIQRIANLFTVFKWVQTQDLNIPELLMSGIRSLDLRVWVPESGDPFFHHGAIWITVDFYQVLGSIVSFLDRHPTEFLYALFIFSGPGNISKVFQKVKYMVGTKLLVTENAGQLTVGEVRGKLITYSNGTVEPGVPTMPSYYKTFTGPGCTGPRNDVARNWEELTDKYLPCFPLQADEDKVYVTQLHTQVDVAGIKKNKGSGGIKGSTRRFNAKLMRWLQSIGQSHPMNIMEFDYWRPSYANVFETVLNSEHL